MLKLFPIVVRIATVQLFLNPGILFSSNCTFPQEYRSLAHCGNCSDVSLELSRNEIEYYSLPSGLGASGLGKDQFKMGVNHDASGAGVYDGVYEYYEAILVIAEYNCSGQ